MSSYFVRPTEPTILSHKEYHELSSTNLFLSLIVPSAQIIPEILNIERFNIALSRALSSFPHFAGRLIRPDTSDKPWMIRLTNSGVPVSLIDSDAEDIFPTDSTAQDLRRIADPLNVTGIINTEGESDEPLLRVTLTRFTKLDSTAIGMSLSHALCDGTGFSLFLGLLSQLYCGLGPVDPPPYYEPKAIKFTDPPNALPPVLHRYDPSAPPPWEHPDRKAMEFVALRLTAAQLAEIHSSVTKGIEHLRVPRADAVVGLLARCLSEVEPESKPIDTIQYVINHRGMGIYPGNAVVNAIFWLSTGIKVSNDLNAHDSVVACAIELRKSLGRLKEPGFIKDMAADLGKIQSQVAWDKMGQDLPAAKEGCLIVNNRWKLDWANSQFGHPGKVRNYHRHPPGPRYVKILAPNPKFVNGTWVSREGEMEATFYVPPNRRKRFEELFEGYAKSLGMTGSVEFLPLVGKIGIQL